MDFLDLVFWWQRARHAVPAARYRTWLNRYRELRKEELGDLVLGQSDYVERVRKLFLEISPHSTQEFPDLPALRGLYIRSRRWAEKGYDLLLPDHPDFPQRLRDLEDPPRGLFAWGAREALRKISLAVVGTREPSELTQAWLEKELRDFLRRQPDVQLVSGGARGVDQQAHRASLLAGRSTLVFLPSGFDEIYPADLGEWVPAIFKAGGIFLSEYSPDMGMRKAYFSERNRLISGFSAAVLAVEARRRSGTLLTTRAAAEQGRPVFVLPGHPYDVQAAGGLDLLAEGATLVRDAQELSVFFDAEIQNFNFNSALLAIHSGASEVPH